MALIRASYCFKEAEQNNSFKMGMVVHACNPSTSEVGARGPKSQSQHGLSMIKMTKVLKHGRKLVLDG